jgi:hypothetical protein
MPRKADRYCSSISGIRPIVSAPAKDRRLQQGVLFLVGRSSVWGIREERVGYIR